MTTVTIVDESHTIAISEAPTSQSLRDLAIPDAASVRTGTTRVLAPVAMTLLGVSVSAGTAPVGASLIVDVNKNGTTVFTTQGNRPTITAAAFASAEKIPDVVALAAGDYLTFDIDQVGSSTPGSDLVITVRYR